MTTAEIESLLERVRSATGPDRDIDGAIEVQARRFQAYAVGLNDETRAKWQHNGPTVFDGDTGYDAERFTVSIDDCLALIELVLPGTRWSKMPDGAVNLYRPAAGCFQPILEVPARAPTTPLALLEALLLALKGMIDAE